MQSRRLEVFGWFEHHDTNQMSLASQGKIASAARDTEEERLSSEVNEKKVEQMLLSEQLEFGVLSSVSQGRGYHPKSCIIEARYFKRHEFTRQLQC